MAECELCGGRGKIRAPVRLWDTYSVGVQCPDCLASEKDAEMLKLMSRGVKTAERNLELKAENAKLREAMKEAAEDIADWGGYAMEYLQDKHDLKGNVEKYLKLSETGNSNG